MAIASGVALGRFGWRMTIITIAKKLEYFLRNRMFGHLEKMSQSYFNNNKTGDLMAHCTNDISTVRMAFGQGTILIVDSLFMTIMTVFLMITKVSPKLTAVSLLPLPFIALIVFIFSRVIRQRFQAVQEAFSGLTDKAQESFSGIRIIKSFVQEQHELASFNEQNTNNFNKSIDLIKIQGALFPLIMSVSMFSIIITLFYGGTLVINDLISMGDLVAFISYIGLLTWPMMAFGFVFNLLQRGFVSLNRINAILNTDPEIIDENIIENIYDIKPEIKLSNLTFRYPGTTMDVLKNINLEIHSGETVAIVGRTGSGKTTLVNLLLRLYNVETSMIEFSGTDINRLPVKKIRDMIGYVPQDNFLFSKPVKENIAFASDHIPFAKVEAAANVAMVHSEIMGFPKKYDTELGERGVNMSGGQKQRVSIARALAKDPEIIILDDSLSAVDTKTEETILGHLREELNARTAIIISHRVSTIKDADKIVVLDEGAIIEQGTHDTLIANGSYYAELYEKQLIEDKLSRE